MASRIVNQHPPIPLSSPLLQNGFHTITYLDLLSLETAHRTSQLANVRKYDKHFKTGWLHDEDEVINSFLHVLTSNRTEFLLWESSAALVISEGKSFRKLLKDEELSWKSCVFIPFNPNNCHWKYQFLIHSLPIQTGLTNQFKMAPSWLDYHGN